MPTKKYARTPSVMWNLSMIDKLRTAWSTKSPVEIAEMLSTKTVKVEPKNITHMVGVLRAKGVDIPHKHKIGVYQILVDEYLEKHPEAKKKAKASK